MGATRTKITRKQSVGLLDDRDRVRAVGIVKEYIAGKYLVVTLHGEEIVARSRLKKRNQAFNDRNPVVIQLLSELK